jgi:hypothetical protein
VRSHHMGHVVTLSSILSASRCLPHIPRRLQPCVYLSNASVPSLSLLPDTDTSSLVFSPTYYVQTHSLRECGLSARG